MLKYILVIFRLNLHLLPLLTFKTFRTLNWTGWEYSFLNLLISWAYLILQDLSVRSWSLSSDLSHSSGSGIWKRSMSKSNNSKIKQCHDRPAAGVRCCVVTCWRTKRPICGEECFHKSLCGVHVVGQTLHQLHQCRALYQRNSTALLPFFKHDVVGRVLLGKPVSTSIGKSRKFFSII